MRRLVVPDVLPRDRQPVLRVVHQRVEAVGRRNRRRVDAERLRCPRRARSPLPASRREYRRQSAGVDLVPLFEAAPSAVSSLTSAPDVRIPLGDPVAVENLAQRVRVPPDGEVGRAWRLADPPPAHVEEAGAGVRPELGARVARVDVGSQARVRRRRPAAGSRGSGRSGRRRAPRPASSSATVASSFSWMPNTSRPGPGRDRDRPRAGRRRGASPVENSPLPSSSTTIAP